MDKEKIKSKSIPSMEPMSEKDDTTPTVLRSNDEVSPTRPAGLNNIAAALGGPGLGKPANFFQLLAAAISNTKLEQEKGPNFMEYLKQSGFKMAWVRAIVALYEEPKKPDDPLGYIVRLMGHGIPEPVDVKRMQDQVARLRVKLLRLQDENVLLREAVENREEAMRKKEEELISLYHQSKYFSDYNSDDDYSDGEEEK